MRFCPSCGIELSPNLMICPRCGASLTNPGMNNEQAMPPTFGPLQENVSQQPAPTIRDAQGGFPAQEQFKSSNTTYGVPPQDTPLYLAPPPYSAGASIPPPSLPPTQLAYPAQPGQPTPPMQATEPMRPGNFYPMAPQPAPVPRPPTPRSSALSRPMLLLLGVVALLLALSGVSLILYGTVIHPAQLHAEATATVQAAFAQEARGTATAQAQASATAQAQANATATVQAQATAEAQATATAIQTLYTQSTSGTPSLYSSLAGQDGNNWDIYDTTDGGSCHFINGALQSTTNTKGYYTPCLALNSNYTDFAFQVQMTITQGDAGGVVFRASSDNVHEYLFRVWNNGDYDLFVLKDSNNTTALIQDHSASILTGVGQGNVLTVIMRGSTIYLYVNQHYLGSASDSTLGSGAVGVFADAPSSNSTSVSFTNAKVWTLQ